MRTFIALASVAATSLLAVPGCLFGCSAYNGGSDQVFQRGSNDVIIFCEPDGTFVERLNGQAQVAGFAEATGPRARRRHHHRHARRHRAGRVHAHRGLDGWNGERARAAGHVDRGAPRHGRSRPREHDVRAARVAALVRAGRPAVRSAGARRQATSTAVTTRARPASTSCCARTARRSTTPRSPTSIARSRTGCSRRCCGSASPTRA